MSASVVEIGGDITPWTWGGGKDDEGWFHYKAKWLVKCTSRKDGPDQVLKATNLPKTGDPWVFGNDVRNDVVCLPTREAMVHRGKENDPGFYWIVDTQFTNKAQYIGTPPRISGNFAKYTKEVVRDRHGLIVLNTAFELFKGAQAEFDANRPTVKVEKTYQDIDLSLIASLVDCVNSVTLWGCPPRTVKLDNVTWEQKFDETAIKYYTVAYEFTISIEFDKNGDLRSGHDRDILNDATKAIGDWDYSASGSVADAVWVAAGYGFATNPKSFTRFYDRKGNAVRVILVKEGPKIGEPWEPTGTADDIFDPPTIHVEYYPERDLASLLDIPSTL